MKRSGILSPIIFMFFPLFSSSAISGCAHPFDNKGTTDSLISAKESKRSPIQLRFLADLNLPTGTSPAGKKPQHPFGGISGATIEGSEPSSTRDSAEVLLLSDDRSDRGPARAYRVKVGFNEAGKPEIELLDELLLRQQDGSFFQKNSVDPEGIALGLGGRYFFSQEGSLSADDVWTAPSLLELDSNLKVQANIPLPGYVFPDLPPSKVFGELNNPQQSLGQRYNLSMEGLSATAQNLFVAFESSFVQDDAAATFNNGSVSRLFRFDLNENQPVLNAAFLYSVEAVRRYEYYPNSAKADVNGVSDILFLSNNKGLVLERGGVVFKLPNGTEHYDTQVFLYAADLSLATNVLTCQAVPQDCAGAKRVAKQLVLDFSSIQKQLENGFQSIDNLEALFLGPKSKAGQPTLWVVSDNNFSKQQRTQILVFEVTGLEEWLTN